MNTHSKRKTLCLFGLVTLLAVFLSHMNTAFAKEETPASLPSSGLPELPDYQEAENSQRQSREKLPDSYDSRDYGYITTVKNQEPFGTCWAFAALAAGEAGMIKKGIAPISLNLSELHLAYFFYHPVNDPLKNTKNDKNINQSGYHYLDAGGNNLFTMFCLARWTGAASEKTVPYLTTPVSKLNPELAYQDAAHLQNARFVNSKDRKQVKKLILEYGAVSSAMFYKDSFQNQNGAYYCPESPVKFYLNNHIVSLIGWDDHYPKENFLATPSKDGAWIAKNSYGSSGEDEGYLYISYEDAVLGGSNALDALSYAFDMETADNYDHNYQYDGSSSVETVKISSGGSLSNVFTVKGNPSGNERLEAVSFSTFSQNVKYSIQVYKDPENSSPTSGSPIFTKPQTGRTTYSGYYTIPLDTKPVFEQGDRFAVAITFHSANGSRIECFIDMTSDIDGIKFISAARNGQSYIKPSSGSKWEDFNQFYDTATARIKAFTTDTTSDATEVETITSSLKRPALTSIQPLNYHKVRIRWKPVGQAKNYEVFRSTKKKKGYIRIGKTSSVRYTDNKRSPGVTYYYKIRCLRKTGGKTVYSRFSPVKSVTTKLEKAEFTKMEVTKNKAVKLQWKKVPGAHGYLLSKKNSKNEKYRILQILYNGNTRAYTDKSSKDERTSHYRIRAFRMVNGKRVNGPSSQRKIST